MIRPVFDDPNLVSDAGLVPALLLAESAGLSDLLDERLSVASPNATAKVRCSSVFVRFERLDQTTSGSSGLC